MSTQPGLQTGSIGLPQVLFQSIAHVAPGVSVSIGLLAAVTFTGPTLPLALLIAGIAILGVASSMGQLSRHIPSSGGLYASISVALGPRVGAFVGWLYLFFEPSVAPLLFMLAAFLGQDLVASVFDITTPTWPIWILGTAAFTYLITSRDVKLSTNVGIVLGLFELGVFVVLAATAFLQHPDQITVKVFDPSYATAGPLEGTFKGVVWGVLLILGFESAAAFGEEARNPGWTVPRALVLAAATVAGFYIFVVWGAVTGLGFDEFAETIANSPNPMRTLAESAWGPAGYWVILVALFNSIIANANASVNTGSRVVFALARNGVLPRVLGRIHPTFQTPTTAVLVQIVAGVVIAFAMSIIWDPLVGLSILSLANAILLIVLYIIVSIATLVYFRRERRSEFSVVLHGVIPIACALFFLVPLYYQFSPVPDLPFGYGNYVALAWIVIGIGLMIYLAARRPQLLEKASLVWGPPRADAS